jgi:pimeloyl-ACP methyl ester carboxylesterase
MPEARLRAVGDDWASTFGVQHLTVHGHRRAYIRAGEGPALVLLHGIGASSATWSALIPMLTERFTVIAPDLLGHGDSDAPRADYSVAAYACGIRDLLALLGVERATVIGHSLGGAIAAQLTYQYPELVERLVLEAAGGVARELHPALRLAALPGAEQVLPLLNNPLGRRMTRLALRALRGAGNGLSTDAHEVLDTLNAMTTAGKRAAFCRTLRASCDLSGQAASLLEYCYLAETVPTMIVWGECDPVLPVAHAHAASVAMPAARLELFPGTGHFPHRADPVRFLQVLTDFMTSTPAAEHCAGAWRERLRRGGCVLPDSTPGAVAPMA